MWRLPDASATPCTETEFCIPFSSTVTVSNVTDMTLSGLAVFDNTFIKGMLAIRADSVICISGPATKTCCPRLSCCMPWTVLSKLLLWRAWTVLILASVCLWRTSSSRYNLFPKDFGSASSVISPGLGLAGFNIFGIGGLRDNTQLKHVVPVDQCTCTFVRVSQHLYVLAPVRLILRDKMSETRHDRSIEVLDLAFCLKVICLLVRFLTPRQTNTATKNVDTNFCLMSVSKLAGIPYGMTQLCTKTVTAFIESTATAVMAPVNFVYRYVNKITCWLSDYFLGNGPSMLIATNSSSLAAGNGHKSFP